LSNTDRYAPNPKSKIQNPKSIPLFYRRHGAGPPLIILHGLLGSGDNWQTLSRKVFAEHFDVFTVDQRNHGRSPHSDVFDYPTMVDDLTAFMEAHRLDTVHLLGHSMGGKTAMHFALTHPGRTDSLIVVDIAPKVYPPAHTVIFDALRSLDFGAYRTRAAIDAALRGQIPDDAVRAFLLKNLRRDGHGGYAWKVNIESIHRNYTHLSGSLEADGLFEGPALFVRGDASDYVADEDRELIISFFPDAEIATIDDAGHWVHADRPREFAEAVLEFWGV